MGNMLSDHTKTLAFIEDYRSFTALWEVNNKDYTNKIKIVSVVIVRSGLQ
jgi:hypothetical protein